MSQNRSLIVLGLTTILLSACAHGETEFASVKMTPTSAFLDGVISEYEKGVHGPHTKEVVKDWVAQNEQ